MLPYYSLGLRIGSAILFFSAVIHTFLTPWLTRLYEEYQHKKMLFPERWRQYLWLSEFLRIVSRVELVFVLWAVPLFFLFLYTEGYRVTMAYFDSRNYVFSLFIIVMLILLESRPIEYFSQKIFATIAKIGNQSPICWWWTIMIAAPLSAFFLKESGAMIIAATLLSKHFYKFSPSPKLCYATMGLLFSNISISGLTSSFSSRALLTILPEIKWTNSFIISHFSWKVVLAILVSTTIFFCIFRKEFKKFPKTIPSSTMMSDRVPLWIIFIHVLLVGCVILSRAIPLFLGFLLVFYLGFQRFTIFYQNPIKTAKVCFVGLFYIGIVIFGELQEWWVLDLMHGMPDFGYMMTSYLFSIFLDNALVNHIVHNLPMANDCYLYLVLVGSMSAGGLTLVSNMPNIVGYLILRPTFPHSDISLIRLFLSAVVPSIVSLSVFWFFREIPPFMFCLFR
ncbi:putative Na+/H+ antiporter [Chlamydia sp.]|uniref:putative Na+/H+ antiporter n=1 Tax=Chlamydia sp. TaxID=35827 RepID=UPI0025B850D4|nr:putative Na+/H+ antiporter [Chlamydia sp.]MBQ8498549.1 putative Na+/H+ antiporter [Chlamydia sp.]